MGKHYKHLTYNDRLQIETLLRTGTSYRAIADFIGVHVSTIYNEVKRGAYEHRNSDWTTEIRYSCDMAEERYRRNLKDKGADLKIGKDHAYADYIEHMICDERYSVDAALSEAKKLDFKTSVTRTTVYSYIDKGVFLRLTNKALPVRGNRKKAKRIIRAKKPPAGVSIEKRPKVIYSRKDFGHWEMDLVIGKRAKSPALLVMTERKTRDEIIRKIPDKASASVVNALNDLEREYGRRFPSVFKSITVDNGVEFSDSCGIEKSIYGGKRTNVYYCHPYCSCERGSNENNNKLIRRHFPKGTNFAHVTDAEIRRVEEWMNAYPRGIFNYRSSAELFRECIALIE